MHNSSLSQDDSLLRDNYPSNMEKYSTLKDAYSPSSYTHDSGYDHTNIKSHQSNLHGSLDRSHSPYSAQDHQLTSSLENLTVPHPGSGTRNVQPFLEAVPERSMEHSEIAYKGGVAENDLSRDKYNY